MARTIIKQVQDSTQELEQVKEVIRLGRFSKGGGSGFSVNTRSSNDGSSSPLYFVDSSTH
ncbi:hypothetical protein E2C01_016402 [Portunus trituberculatus]|uniref:Uncharacterized protein n=1 Tax=Portunus trituberculatus TaxID=210409 RepID=A0A5B7DPH6_PORTR|nr:hypothetical protein [Portunus trituberculatus]